MIDTRAGFWLLAVIGIIDLLIMLAMVLWVEKDFLTFSNFLSAMALPMNLLLPVLGILSITQEWGQRTALVSFTLVPRRARVVVSKLLASVVLALASLVVAMVLAAIGAITSTVAALFRKGVSSMAASSIMTTVPSDGRVAARLARPPAIRSDAPVLWMPSLTGISAPSMTRIGQSIAS